MTFRMTLLVPWIQTRATLKLMVEIRMTDRKIPIVKKLSNGFIRFYKVDVEDYQFHF